MGDCRSPGRIHELNCPPIVAASGDLTESSGGAIVHTGSLRVLNSTFMGNEAGVEGTAITSLGFLETLSNVSFSENTYYCGAGKYGYIVQNEARNTP